VEGDEDMLERTHKVLIDLWATCEKLEIRKMICAGDLFDQAYTISIRAIDSTLALVARLQANYPLEFYCLTGNHDLGTRNIDQSQVEHSSINLLAHAKLAIIADNIELYTRKAIFRFVPYMLQPQSAIASTLRELTELVEATEDYRGYLVIHQTPSINTLNLPADFDGEAIQSQRISYLSGHIHKPAIGIKGRILGSPCHLAADDLGQNKCIYILLADGSLRAIPTNYTTVRPHIVQQLAAIETTQEEATEQVYGRPVIWDILDEYSKGVASDKRLVYIQQFIGK